MGNTMLNGDGQLGSALGRRTLCPASLLDLTSASQIGRSAVEVTSDCEVLRTGKDTAWRSTTKSADQPVGSRAREGRSWTGRHDLRSSPRTGQHMSDRGR